jgi:hypothetical protein
MSIFNRMGRAIGKVPGMNTLAKPMNAMMSRTPGLRGVPQALGTRPMPKPGIGPSNAPMMNQMAQNMASVGSQVMPGEGYAGGMNQQLPTDVTPMPDIPSGGMGQANWGSSIPMPNRIGGLGPSFAQAGAQMGNQMGQKPRLMNQNRNQQMMQKQSRAFTGPQY